MRIHSIASGISLGIVSLFALYWINPSHIPHNFSGSARIFDVMLFLLLTYVIWHPIVMEVISWSLVSHIKKRPVIKPPLGLKIAFVTTFVPASESISLLKKTLPAIVRVNYEHDSWLLDEGDDPAVKALCALHGVKYFSRLGEERYNTNGGKYAKKTKAGNHNSWYDTFGHAYDFVAQVDTDFIPRKNFLNATLGIFRDPKIAFVGTPQIYGNEKKSLIAKGAAQQTYNFYGPVLRGMDGMDTMLLIGANHVIRVAALEDVGHYSAHITEDLLTGMKLHAAGWKSAYIPKVLARGEGPATWKAYFDQQKRWAYGCMHILFNHSSSLLRLTNNRRSLYYFMIQQHYFGGVAMGLSILCLSLYFAFGFMSARIDLLVFLSFYIPVLLVMIFMTLWQQRFNIRPKKERGILWAGIYINLAAWPIFLLAFFSLFKHKRLTYKVTPKGHRIRKNQPAVFKLFIPHLAIATIGMIGLISSQYSNRKQPLMLFWAVTTVLFMFMVPIFIPFSIFLTKKSKEVHVLAFEFRKRYLSKNV